MKPVSPESMMTEGLHFLRHRPLVPALFGLALFSALMGFPNSAEAHVKWFSEYSYADRPLTLTEVLTPTAFWLWGLAVLVSVSLTVMEEKVTAVSWIRRIDDWFASKSEYAMFVMRLGVGVTLVWCWQAGRVLAPDLSTDLEWLGWLQFATAFLLVFDRTVKFAGVGIFTLYLLGISQFGFFHMLDYFLYVGIAWFFIAYESKNPQIQITALPAVYSSLGFSLIWLGLEKLFYPAWSVVLLDQHPVLALGMDHDLFVTVAAMVEIGLGFMIMVCLQERLLALFITLVFILTTMVFGRAEVAGHTLIHTVLIVFLFAGPGEATPPLQWIREMKWRLPATGLAFVLMVGILAIPYSYGAAVLYQSESRMIGDMHDQLIEIEAGQDPPAVAIALLKDPVKGWNVQLTTENFEFAPASAGLEPEPGKGHAHLMIDGKKVARLYGHWHHLPNLPAGKHEILVTLNANNHAGLAVNGRPIQASTEIEVLASPE